MTAWFTNIVPEHAGQPELTETAFTKISRLVKTSCGINLHAGKVELVKARLGKRLRQLGCTSYQEYLDYLKNDLSGRELDYMLTALSTNVTSFFREPSHFGFLSERILRPRIQGKAVQRRMRIWSAGCSSGEEPYSIAMVAMETIGTLAGWDIRILATDLSLPALQEAKAGMYSLERVQGLSRNQISKYFHLHRSETAPLFSVNPEVRRLVYFARLNLMNRWPMRGPFDIIFCRNVMIYFERDVRQGLVRRFHELLAPGGYLFIGHSESFSNIQHEYVYLEPTIYQKK